MSSALRDIYIILYAYTYIIQSADFTRVSKTTESGIGRKDGNLLSFFLAHISRGVTAEVGTGDKKLSAYLSLTHTNYFIYII